MQEPQEIQDEEHEQPVARVAAIDVAKASGMVCTRVPHASGQGRRVTKVGEVPATTGAIIELGGHLAGLGIEQVTVESTSDYWRVFCYLLEAAGLRVQLVNARDVKHLPGRPKTDKLDSVWLAKLTERGMLRPSFVPPAQIRQLRDDTRLRLDLTRDRSRHVQRIEKLLEDALIKLSTVATDIMGKSGRAMLEALIAGQRDPKALADLARGRLRVKHAALVQALTGRFDDHHAELARMLLDQYDALTAQIDRLTARIEALIAAIPAAQGVDADGTTGPGAGTGPDAAVLPAIWRLDEVPASRGTPHRCSWPSSAWTWASSPAPPTWCHGPSCAHGPSSPAPSTARAPPAGATPTSEGSSARPPPRPPRPTPSWGNATGGWSSVAASSRPWSPSPAPSW